MIKKIFFVFVAWRFFLFLPVFFSHSIFPIRQGYEYVLFSDYLKYFHLSPLPFLLTSFANFDGLHYITIAHFGYTINAGFFPLFPILLQTMGAIISLPLSLQIDTALLYAGIILNSFLFLFSLYVLYGLLRADYKNKTILQTTIFLLCFPTSFFFATVYSESLFFCLLLLVFYFSRKRQWLLVAVFGLLLTSTRFVGIAILPAIIYEFIKLEKISIKKFPNNWILWVKLSVVSLTTMCGIGMYAVFNYIKWGDPLFFIHAQGAFNNNRSVSSLVLFPQTIFRYIKILFTVSPAIYEWWVAFLELSMFLFIVGMLILAWKKKVRTSYLIFSVLCILIPSMTGTFTGLPRYVLVLFPCFIAIALVKNKFFKVFYVIVSIILLFILFSLFAQGYYVA